ncbi:hypothetical protein N7523_010803 [Penicillium sp. IBT 18751x]|nr:hypothetical protein N7523_010803 [Penicillium sp. IBT 18751x]
MRPSVRFLAAISHGRSSRLKKPAISLDHFIQRGRVLAFWREVVRALNSTHPSLSCPPKFATKRRMTYMNKCRNPSIYYTD